MNLCMCVCVCDCGGMCAFKTKQNLAFVSW